MPKKFVVIGYRRAHMPLPIPQLLENKVNPQCDWGHAFGCVVCRANCFNQNEDGSINFNCKHHDHK